MYHFCEFAYLGLTLVVVIKHAFFCFWLDIMPSHVEAPAEFYTHPINWLSCHCTDVSRVAYVLVLL